MSSVKSAIKLIRHNIETGAPYKKIVCKGGCCISGIRFENIKFNAGWITMKNGFVYKLSCDLGNQIEDELMPLIRKQL
jgi:hypothetical protein